MGADKNGPRVTFHGAAREVTGSCHLVEAEGAQVLLECGMIQGGPERHQRNREPFPFPATALRCAVLSHAHIDHSGRLPLLVRRGYRGPILATEPTARLCRILLADSGRLHEEDARWKIKRLKKRGEDASWVRPLYTEEEALAVMDQLVPVAVDRPHELDGLGTVTFRTAGHILGAAIVQLDLGQAGRTLTFSGDLGVAGARLLGRPSHVPCPDHLLIESTYGDRERAEEGDRTELLYRILSKTFERGGKVVIPSFAVGRTQEVLARLNDLVEAARLPGVAVYVDSPLAINATEIFADHPEAYSRRARAGIAQGDHPLEFAGLTFTCTVEESKAINDCQDPCVIIAGSGMCTGGRIKHHLKRHIEDPRSTVLFVGYQARGTLGRSIQSGVSPVRIFGDWHEVRAQVASIEGFSAHADRGELLEWFAGLGGVPKHTFVVHGEEDASVALARTLQDRFGAAVTVPEPGQSYPLE